MEAATDHHDVGGDERPLKAEAELALSKGHVQRAESLYRNLLLYERDLHGEDWPGQLSALHILARLLLLRQDYAEAIQWLEKALVITVTFCGEGPETASAMVTLAGALRKSGAAVGDADQQAEAEQLYLQAIEAFVRQQPGGSAEAAAAMVGLAMCCEAQGRLGEARTLYEDALAMRRRVLGPAHADTADTLLCLASLLSRTWETSVAMVRYEQAITLFRSIYPSSHARVALVRDSLRTLFLRQAKELRDQGLYGEACVASSAGERGCVGNAIAQGYFQRKEPGMLVGASLRKIFAAVFPCMSAESVARRDRQEGQEGQEAEEGDELVLVWAYDEDQSAQSRALPGMTVATSLWRAMQPAHTRSERAPGELFGQGFSVPLGRAGGARAEVRASAGSGKESGACTLSIVAAGGEVFSAQCDDEGAMSAWREAVATGRVIGE